MPTQVVLAGCVDSHVTPRIRIQGDFSMVCVGGLDIGDELWLELHDNGQAPRCYALSAGLSVFPPTQATHFSVRKKAGPSPEPTTVEIIRR